MGAVVGTLGLLALIVGLIMFVPIKALRARRTVAVWLSVGGGVCFALGLAISPKTIAHEDRSATSVGAQLQSPLAAASRDVESRIKADDSSFPVISVEVYLGSRPVDADTISRAAQAVKQFAEELEQKPRWHMASAINFTFAIRSAGQAAHNFMYLTEDVDKMRSLTALKRGAAAYLTVARDGHVAEISDEKAAREYCSGSSVGFCSRYSF